MEHVGLNDVGLNDVIQSLVRHILCAHGHLRYVGCRLQTHSKLKIKISIISLNITRIKFSPFKGVMFFSSNNKMSDAYVQKRFMTIIKRPDGYCWKAPSYIYTLMLACLPCGLCMETLMVFALLFKFNFFFLTNSP